MTTCHMSKSGFYVKTAAITMVLLFIVSSISALDTSPTSEVTMDRGGETLVVLKEASREEFQAVVDLINEEHQTLFEVLIKLIFEVGKRDDTAIVFSQ